MSTYIYYCDHCHKIFGSEKQENDTIKVCSICQNTLRETEFTLDEWNGLDPEEKEEWKQKWQDEKEKEQELLVDRLPVTTADLKIEYLILKPVCAQADCDEDTISDKAFDQAVRNLKKKAYALGADAVVGMNMLTAGKTVQVYGTAVKKKKPKKA